MIFFINSFIVAFAMLASLIALLSVVSAPWWIHRIIEKRKLGPQWLQGDGGFIALILLLWPLMFATLTTAGRYLP